MQNRPDNRIYAGFFVRLAAYIVDTVIVWAAMLIVRIPVWVTTISSPDNFLVKDFIFQYSIKDILFYIMQAAYFVMLTYFTGSTLGKKLFQIRVVSAEDRKMTFFEVTFRETVGRFLSALILSIGYIMIAIDKKKRGLHDILSDTNVVYYHEKKVYTHADIHYRNMVDANVQAVAQPQNPNSYGEVNAQSQSPNPYEKVNAQSQSPNPYGEVNRQPQNQNPYGEVNVQPQNQNPYEKVNTQPQNQDNKSVYSNDTDDFDNTNNAEVSSVKTVHPQNMPSGYFEDTGDKDGK
ncbi:MAG: hypothetical protein BHW08_09535 [Clostridium sp. CAG:12237_41]|nr:MAG: hypothetical protein BHW08_09535 [Clostridium sp. CAG:12237_41]